MCGAKGELWVAVLLEKGSLQNISKFGKRLARQFLKSAYILGLKMTLASASANRQAPFSDHRSHWTPPSPPRVLHLEVQGAEEEGPGLPLGF